MRKYAKEESMKFANCQRSFSSSFLASKKMCDINGSYGVMDFIHKLSFDAKSLFLLRVKKILHVSDTSFFISQSDHLVSDLGTRRVFIKRLFTQVVHQFFTQSFSFIPVAVYIRHYRKESPVCSIKLHKKKLI